MMEFITITCVGLLVIISPGPDFAIVTKTSLTQGRLTAIMTSLGIALANLCHVAINLLGIGVIISQSIIAFTIMKVLGAAYLLYLGIKGLRAKSLSRAEGVCEKNKVSKANNESRENIEKKFGYSTFNVKQGVAKRGLMTGFLTSLLNPKACLFYLSFFSVILSPETALSLQVFYGIWLCFLAFAWFTLVSIFFTNPSISIKLREGKHWIERFAGVALVFLGLRLLSAEASL